MCFNYFTKKVFLIQLFVSLLIFFYSNSFIFSKTTSKKLRSTSHIKLITTIIDSSIVKGITYKHLLVKNGRYNHKVHLMILDLNEEASIELLLSDGKIGSLKMLQDVYTHFDSINGYSIAGLVNGSFWSKYNLFPVGTTFINGEVIELKRYKNWSAAYFDEAGKLHIGHFSISASAQFSSGNKLFVSSVNRRTDSLSVVLYNCFAGDSIPYIHKSNIDKILKETLLDSLYNDSTEIELNLDSLKKELLNQQRLASIEYSMWKASLLYLNEPIINKNIKCYVASIDTGLVEIPNGGCILSLGNNIASEFIPDIGDTLTLKFTTNELSNTKFINGLSGTPCLLRNGKLVNEARTEGSRSKRFINRKLPRTAIGTNKSKDKIYLVCVENGNRNHRTTGASLYDMSYIMKLIGASDALNLDGGGSSSMIIGQKNVARNNSIESRRVVLSIAAVKHMK